MKKKGLFLFIMFLLLISTFGAFTVGAINHTENGACPIAMGSDCSYMDNAFAMAMHHIDSMQDLIDGAIVSGLSTALMVLAVLALFWFTKLRDQESVFTSKTPFIFSRYKTQPIFARILKSIALRNKLDIYSQY
jgi:hypothetical protein